MDTRMTIFLIFFLFYTLAVADYTTPDTEVSWTLDSLVVHSSGTITGSNHAFQITGDLTVSSSDTVFLLPGDTLRFTDQSGSDKIIVPGSIVANGAEGDSIIITSANKTPGDYGGFKFQDNAPGSRMEFDYIICEYADEAFRCINSAPIINRSTIRHTYDAAFNLTGSNAIIKNSILTQHHRSTIKMTLSSSPLIENNQFSENNYQNTSPLNIISIGLQGTNSPTIRGNHIVGKYNRNGAISIWNASNALIEYNIIENCAFGILCYFPNASPTIRKNVFLNNTINPDTVLYGFAIACNGNNSPIISGNYFKGNFYGVAMINGGHPNVGDLSNSDTTDDGGNYFVGNGIGHKKYELFNNTNLNIMAEGNWWGTQNADSVEARIVHQHDDPALGIVDYDPFIVLDPLTVSNKTSQIAGDFSLLQNYPNPFNPSTVIPFSLQKNANVEITIYNLSGQIIRRLYQSNTSTGRHSVQWDGKNDMGISVSSGVYICRLQAGNVRLHKRMWLVR